jgi:hypothetical protein
MMLPACAARGVTFLNLDGYIMSGSGEILDVTWFSFGFFLQSQGGYVSIVLLVIRDAKSTSNVWSIRWAWRVARVIFDSCAQQRAIPLLPRSRPRRIVISTRLAGIHPGQNSFMLRWLYAAGSLTVSPFFSGSDTAFVCAGCTTCLLTTRPIR